MPLPVDDEEAAPADDVEALAPYFKALANEKRLRLLKFLVKPRYLEEMASELKVARQTAQEHLQQLVDLGLVQSRRGRRDHGPVTEYVVAPQQLFTIYDRVGKLGQLEPEGDLDELHALTSPLRTGAPSPKERELPRLMVVHGLRIGETTTLTGDGPWLVGRDPAATLCIDHDPYISTRHAEVRRADGGGFEVADLYSRNGTLVDWEPIPRGGAVPVANGTILQPGKTILVFRRPEKV